MSKRQIGIRYHHLHRLTYREPSAWGRLAFAQPAVPSGSRIPCEDGRKFHGPITPVAQAIWSHRDKNRAYLPKPAAEAKSLRELLDALLGFVMCWQRETEGRGGA
jgi:hypothetical protein